MGHLLKIVIHHTYQIASGALVGLLFGFLGVRISSDITQALFTVYGILFSISASLMIGFNTRGIRNKEARTLIHDAIKSQLGLSIREFIISAFLIGLPSLLKSEYFILIYERSYALHINTISTTIIFAFLLSSVTRLQSLKKLSVRIDDKLESEQGKSPKDGHW